MPVRMTQEDGAFRLDADTRIAAPLAEVFSFFADANNLEAITPSQLRFKVLTPQPIDMAPGVLIDYRLRLHGLPIRWRSEISVWEPPYRFVDEQRRGPYKYWIHEHRFEPQDGGTIVHDRVNYAVPGGRLMHYLFVARDLKRIFSYREAKLREYFPD